MPGVRLEWDGKSAEVPRLRLPLQAVETVNASRADRGTLSYDRGADDGWRNKLIWGDNLHVLASLAEELAGQVDLIYIDPPFDSRQDYEVQIGVGEQYYEDDYVKLQSVIEEKAYRDTWGKGRSSYLQMLYERLSIARELLSSRGSLVVHVDWHQSHYVKAMLDELMDDSNFRNEIVWWYYNKYQGNIKRFASNHDTLLWYSKTDSYQFTPQKEPRGETVRQIKRVWNKDKQKIVNAKDPKTGKVLYQETDERAVDDVWRLSMLQPADKTENVRFQTQKPLSLASRIISALTSEGDLVADFFCGSGTVAIAAERLQRRWIAVDLGRFAIHTTRKRLLDVSQCRPFVVANLGRYERQAWQNATTGPQVQAYLEFVVALYEALPTTEFQHLHGTKGRRAVHVGAVDAAVSFAEIKESLDEAAAASYPGLDVLGWEFEMGLHELVQDEARARGIDLQLRRIPREVMDARAVDSGEVVFHELAYLEVATTVEKRNLTVTLTDFVLPNPDLVPVLVRSKISGWADYVDYWAVDFTYGIGGHGDTFYNQWQSYRTRVNRTLERNTTHDYDQPGSYTVLVKVVDIFGNDTTMAVEVSVK
ncbi:MAG: DNA methyltransferase [Pseudonocardiaceae bacterium]